LAKEEIRRASIRVRRRAERGREEPGERFVGRERELAQLSGALDKIATGHGRMFMVSGEPGIGKTRLADELSALAQARGLRVIWGAMLGARGSPVYWPLNQIIRVLAERPDFSQLAEALGHGIEQVAVLSGGPVFDIERNVDGTI
jgi:AAA ATPase domain